MILVILKTVLFYILASEIIYNKWNERYPIIDKQSCYILMSYISVPILIVRGLIYQLNPTLALII